MTVKVITGEVIKSNSNPKSVGVYKDGKKSVRSYSRGNNYVSPDKVSTKEKAQASVNEAAIKNLPSSGKSPSINNPNYDSQGRMISVSPLSAGGANSTVSPTSPNETTSSSSQEQNTEFGGGGRGRQGDTANKYVALYSGNRYETMGEALNDDWQTYKPVLGLALWEAGAIEQVISRAGKIISNIASKFGKAAKGSKFNWAQEEIVRTGEAAVTETGGAIKAAVNSKTLFGLNKNLVAAGFGVTTAAFIIKESLGSKTFSNFQIAEALDKIGYARVQAVEAGDLESIAELEAMSDDLLNQNLWQNIGSFVPFIGGNVGTKQNIEAANLANNIYKKLSEYKANGVSDTEMWADIRLQQAEAEKASIDYYNQQRQQMIAWEREAARMARDEDAAFWAKQRKEQDRLELEQAKAIADFWTEYRKKVVEYNNSRASTYEPPSNLNFGLI